MNTTRVFPSNRLLLALLSDVRLSVYDAVSREVAVVGDASLGAGWHEAALVAAGLPAGGYAARLSASSRVLTQRLTGVR